VLLRDNYDGNICLEGYPDPLYQGDWETTGQLHAPQHLKWCRGGNFASNPRNGSEQSPAHEPHPRQKDILEQMGFFFAKIW